MGWVCLFFLIKTDLPHCCCLNKLSIKILILKYSKCHSEHTVGHFYPLLKTGQVVHDPGVGLDFST